MSTKQEFEFKNGVNSFNTTTNRVCFVSTHSMLSTGFVAVLVRSWGTKQPEFMLSTDREILETFNLWCGPIKSSSIQSVFN